MELYEDQYDVCPHCGYEEGFDDHQLLHIDPGQILVDRYIIGKSLGFGGFGVTYLGWDTKLQRKVAIKEYLPSEFATRMIHHQEIMVDGSEKKTDQFNSGMNRFLKEGEKLAQVGDIDGIVHMYDCFQANNTAYITMEYLKGMTLTQFLDEKGVVSEQEVMDLMLPIFKALETVHEKGIIHRDIAPDNLFVTYDEDGNEKLKLIDFGASKFASSSHSKSLTVMIKPGYSPEEQYRSNGDQGTYTDVYALAAVMYKMVTGVQPPDSFERRTAIESHKKDPLIEPGKFNSNLSANFEIALLNALNVRIEDRTTTVSDFESELVSFDPVKRRGSSIRRIDYMRWPLWAKIGVPVASLAAVGLVVFAITKVFTGAVEKYSLPAGYTRVPDFVEADFDTKATEWATEAKVNIEKQDTRNSAKYPRNLVLAQQIPSGSIVNENTVIGLTISSGEEVFVMPDVKGMRLEDARKAIECMGGEVVIVSGSQDGLIFEGVIDQDVEPFGEFKYGSTVKLTINTAKSVSLNKTMGSSLDKDKSESTEDNADSEEKNAFDKIPSGKAPDIKGLSYEDALEKVSNEGWTLFVSGRSASNDKASGEVLSLKISDSQDDQNVLDITVAMPVMEFEIPNLELKSREDAIQLLKNLGIEVEIKEESNELVTEGKIFNQSIPGQSAIKSGDKVIITVSTGGKPFEMPKLTALSQEEAEKTGREKNLVVEVEYDFDPNIPIGSVISQSVDDGEIVKRGQSVKIFICSNENIISVPGLAGMNIDEAKALLEKNSLNFQVEEIESIEPRNTVISQIPDAGSRKREGDTIVITVSKGGLVEMPYVVGQGYDGAKGTLESMGLKVKKDEAYSDSVPQGNVSSQSVSAGSIEKTGTTVTLTVSRGKDAFKVTERPWHLSDWSTDPPAGAEIMGTKTEYRARNRETTTSDQASLGGWIQIGSHQVEAGWSDWSGWSDSSPAASATVQVESGTFYRSQTNSPIKHENWGGWSEWQDSEVTASPTRKVETQSTTLYNYSRYAGNGRVGPCAGTWSGIVCNEYQERGWGPQLDFTYTTYSGQVGGDFSCYGGEWYNEVTKTEIKYRYQDCTITYTDNWGGWSDWSQNAVASEFGKVNVETKTMYQSKTQQFSTIYDYERWSDWSGYSDSASGDDVQSRTVYQWKEYD